MKRLAMPNLATLSRRERLLAIGSALVVAVVAMDRLVLGPWLHHIQTTHRDIQRLEKLIRSDRELIRRQPQILGQAEAYREYLRVDTAAQPDMASLLREIETLGGRSGVVLGQVKPLQAEEQGGAAGEAGGSPGLAIEVDCKGSLQEWVHFVYLLQSSQALFEIERATVARTEAGSSQVEGLLRLISKVYQGGQASGASPSTAAGAS